MKVTPSQLTRLLEAYIPAGLPVLVTGAPGVGKSCIVAAAAAAAGYDLLISHPVVEDPTDSKGLPFPGQDGHSARFLPFGDLETALNSIKPLVWFFDDLGQASPAVQAAKMQLLLARRIGDHVLPNHVTFVAATNRRIDNAGVSGMLDPLKSRFATIVELVPDPDEWAQWAVQEQRPPELIAFMSFRPKLLSSDERAPDMENRPSPRGWEFVARQMAVVPPDLELIAFAGTVGEGAALEFQTFREIYRQLPSVAGVLAYPDRADIPDEPSAKLSIATAIGSVANENNFDRIMIYADRMHREGGGDAAVLMVSEAIRRDQTILSTPAFIRAQSGPIGRAILGQ
ncbi:ATP-binding protein [Ralstonia nicotianae]|uniref:ATP-binding protein n=1 Tax=Ralstonia pseudosolanacearum TaxID=1310165 RepID=UPI002003154D|nr:ATP-binding protein [Ralstonia pseudosolanacearum]MCK4120422.1 ATP-binding protein [Ralstonia pseudosolanacearum]